MGQEGGDGTEAGTQSQQLERSDGAVPFGAESQVHKIRRDQGHSQARGEGDQGEAFSDSQQIAPERRMVLLDGGEDGRSDLTHQAGDLLNGDVRQVPPELIQAKGSLTQDPAGDEKVGVGIPVP